MAQKTKHHDCLLLTPGTRLHKISPSLQYFQLLDIGNDDQPDETVLAQDMEELARERPRHRPVLRFAAGEVCTGHW